MKLIIVESPTKAKTINKFLGSEYKVESSFGHIRDLPKSKMGIDIENNFQPQYIIPTKARKTVNTLKKLAKEAETIILASDEDREGEAIAWHLQTALNIDPENTQRIVFHEITKSAILEALKNPRTLNQNLVDAQQARRILDRLVGYELSPFLWKKVAKGLSAGRVQSVATRLVVEREKEIKAFKSEEYWTISSKVEANKTKFIVDLYKVNNKILKKFDLKKDQIKQITEDLNKSDYTVEHITTKETKKNPLPPFTTSTLQQSANRILGFSAKQTMMIAQKLYEKGYITYMRTDSLNLSTKFISEAEQWINSSLGKNYAVDKGRVYKTKNKNAQEAHEAIRPTEANQTPDDLQPKLDKNQFRLYQLIWQRAIASQMASAKLNVTAIEVSAQSKEQLYSLRTSGQIISFPGYLKIYPEKTKEQILPELKEKQTLILKEVFSEEHNTMPPARYSDAGLVKALEKYNIGRPSTYAPTIATIITRNYVERDEKRKLKPTDIAFVVIDLLLKHFSQIVDYSFTAKLEEDLDLIASGEKKWVPVIKNFYIPFHENLEQKYKEINKEDIMPEEKSNEKCDKCGADMIIKTGRYGKFLACSAFPECKNIKPLNKESNKPAIDKELEEKYKDEICEKCGSKMVIKVGKYGPFLACSAYPKCKNIKNINTNGEEDLDITCPVCKKGKIVKKFSKRGVFYACNAYPECKNAYWGKPTGKTCPNCGSLMILNKQGKEVCSNKECA